MNLLDDMNFVINVKLSEDFIREFQEEVDWITVSSHQKLSENFIREFQNRVSWCWICSRQELSEKFVRDFYLLFKDHPYWVVFLLNSNDYSKEFKDEISSWTF